MEIINFEPDHYEALLAFIQKHWPRNTEEYLKFRLFQFPEKIEDNKYNLLVINDMGTIIGCALYIPTKARINGKEELILWSHNLFVEEQYRGAAGLLLLIEMHKIKSTFGFGATDINFKIQKELGTKFIGTANSWHIFNIWSFKLLLNRLKLLKSTDPGEYKFPDRLKIGSSNFRLVSNLSQLSIPNKGYWNEGSIDIDFIRDEHFIKNRFFENFNKYYFYTLEAEDTDKPCECYFVVRPLLKKGYEVLSIVDFRFNLKKSEQFRLILNAGTKLGMINRIPLTTVLTSFKFRKDNIASWLYRHYSEEHILTYLPISNNSTVFVTSADSDADFLSE